MPNGLIHLTAVEDCDSIISEATPAALVLGANLTGGSGPMKSCLQRVFADSLRSYRFSIMAFSAFIISTCALQAAPTKIAVVGPAEMAMERDILTTTLSQIAGLVVVERGEIDRVLAEKANALVLSSSKDSFKAGRILEADVLIVLNPVIAEGQDRMEIRVIAVRPGVVVAVREVSMPVTDWDTLSRTILDQLDALLPKLHAKDRELTAVSLLNFRATLATTETRKFETSLKTRVAVGLQSAPKVVLLERVEMERLHQEAVWSPEPAGFWSGAFLVEGVIEVDVHDQSTWTGNVRILAPGGSVKSEFKVSGTMQNPQAAAESIVAGILENLQIEGQPVWNITEEQSRFAAEAQWAYHNGNFLLAKEASEAAYALGDCSRGLADLRVLAGYESIARDKGHPSPGPQRSLEWLESAAKLGIETLQIFYDGHAGDAKMEETPDARITRAKSGDLALRAGSFALWYADHSKLSLNPELAETLRMWCSRVEKYLWKKAGEDAANDIEVLTIAQHKLHHSRLWYPDEESCYRSLRQVFFEARFFVWPLLQRAKVRGLIPQTFAKETPLLKSRTAGWAIEPDPVWYRIAGDFMKSDSADDRLTGCLLRAWSNKKSAPEIYLGIERECIEAFREIHRFYQDQNSALLTAINMVNSLRDHPLHSKFFDLPKRDFVLPDGTISNQASYSDERREFNMTMALFVLEHWREARDSTWIGSPQSNLMWPVGRMDEARVYRDAIAKKLKTFQPQNQPEKQSMAYMQVALHRLEQVLGERPLATKEISEELPLTELLHPEHFGFKPPVEDAQFTYSRTVDWRANTVAFLGGYEKSGKRYALGVYELNLETRTMSLLPAPDGAGIGNFYAAPTCYFIVQYNALWYYDKSSDRWGKVENIIPGSNEWCAAIHKDYLYLVADIRDDHSEKGVNSCLVRIQAGTGLVEILVNPRRYPPKSPLDRPDLRPHQMPDFSEGEFVMSAMRFGSTSHHWDHLTKHVYNMETGEWRDKGLSSSRADAFVIEKGGQKFWPRYGTQGFLEMEPGGIGSEHMSSYRFPLQSQYAPGESHLRRIPKNGERWYAGGFLFRSPQGLILNHEGNLWLVRRADIEKAMDASKPPKVLENVEPNYNERVFDEY